ncbi:ABC transporter substrate-binding protein [Halomicronema sp. CCY15110]|uniref:ABC transporter substrate-binding protein n=1 Tax=Halomicronema sp. CCY15110 TaxID=2767773 RepID=UPI00194E48FC|nr:ABC transporter substrate-binding protein [Halomicronema sp. CCY15110]
MAKRNEIAALLGALLITGGLLGGLGWWAYRQFAPSLTSGGGAAPTSGNAPTGATADSPGGTPQARISVGDRLLVAEPASPTKTQAVEALQAGDFETAIAALTQHLEQNRNDPEARILLNNAEIGGQAAYTIAVAAPVATAVNPAKEMLRGVAQAQAQINQTGGINGTPLQVAIASDDDNPQTATQVAQALADNPDILGVVGHFGSDTSLAASAVYDQAGLAMISPTSTSVELSNVADEVFRTVPSDRFTATSLSRYAVTNFTPANLVVFFNGESGYSESLKSEFTTAIYSDGGQILAEFDVSDAQFDAATAVSQAIQQGATGLVLLTNTSTLEQALQVIQVNQQRLALLGGDSLYNPQVLEAGGRDAVDMVVAVPWILGNNTESEFAQTARQLWGGDVNWRTAMAYDATLTLAAALRSEPTRAGVVAALQTPGFQVDGATGTVQFLPSGDRNQAMQLVEVVPSDRTSFGYQFQLVSP